MSTPNSINYPTPAQEFIKIAAAGMNKFDLSTEPQEAILVPDGYKVEILPFPKTAPLEDFIEQRLTLNDAESMVGYIKRHKTVETVLFATLPKSANGAGAEFRAVFDYHQPGKDNKPNRALHQAIFPCPLSDPWAKWTGVSGRAMSQIDFVNWIEANSGDVVTPDAAALMEMAIGFESKTEVTFLSKINRLTGARELTFNEVIDAQAQTKSQGSMKVPDGLTLKLAVFEGGKSFDVKARLEWRPNAGKLHVTIHLLDMQKVVRTALTSIREDVETGSELRAMVGHLG